MTNQNTLQLYPSSWLYNAGVIGFLRSAEEIEQIEVNKMIDSSGVIYLNLPFFSKLDTKRRYFSESKIASIVAKNEMYRNFLQSSEKEMFLDFVKNLDNVISGQCDLCINGKYLDKFNDNIKEIETPNYSRKQVSKFLNRIKNFSIVHNSHLGPSINKFPNAFWNLDYSIKICHLCSFLVIHHHLAFTKLSDKSEIFIDAPSFQIMYYLNKFTQEIFGSSSMQDARNKREILAMSVIEYATKIQANLASWVGMNIEIISRHGDKIEFFSLPYEVTKLLADRRIAAILSQIGEYSILNLVLDQDFSSLMEMGYRLLRIGLIPYQDRGKNEKDFVNQILQLEKNRRNPTLVAQQIFQLCVYIHEKHKTNAYGYHKH
ncbi:MAG: hypothetical protein IRZ01_08450 [Thermoflavifilum aggregans]|nr:hypothetical protein [Thermoflavifilum aggregans]